MVSVYNEYLFMSTVYFYISKQFLNRKLVRIAQTKPFLRGRASILHEYCQTNPVYPVGSFGAPEIYRINKKREQSPERTAPLVKKVLCGTFFDSLECFRLSKQIIFFSPDSFCPDSASDNRNGGDGE